jgi:hypothetical protein
MYTATDDGWYRDAFAGRVWPRPALAELAAKIDGGAPLWFVAREVPGPEVDQVVGRALVGEHIELALTVTTSSESTAKLLVTAVKMGVGVPAELRRFLVKSVAWNVGAVAEVRSLLDADDVIALARLINAPRRE